jgi:hypothetical protein
MENKAEDEVRKKWEQEAKDKAEREEATAQRPKKRPRAIGYRNDVQEAMNKELLALLKPSANEVKGGAKVKEGAPKLRRAAGTRAKSRITELTEEEEEVVELD